MRFLEHLFKKQEPAKTGDSGISSGYKAKSVYSPLAGTVIPLSEVEDPVFSQGVMGEGVGIRPDDGKLFAPVSGTIAALFPTCHAVGIQTEDGMELLLHIGIDTVELEGKGFQAAVKQGDTVKAGELLVTFDVAAIEAAGYKATTMVLVSNAASLGQMSQPKLGRVNPLEELFSFE